MTKNTLHFSQAQSEDDIVNLFNFNTKAFAGTQDFDWSIDNIKKEVNNGWNLYSVEYGNEIVAVAFLREDDKKLLTKNTSIKLEFQGNGFSHMIKDFYEEFASDKGLKEIMNYCSFDNFRMISLNERHDYSKTGNKYGNNYQIIEWHKNL